MQLRKLSRHDFLGVPHIVIPNLFRDLGVDLIQGRVRDLGRETMDGSCQRPAALKSSPQMQNVELSSGERLRQRILQSRGVLLTSAQLSSSRNLSHL